MKRLVVGLGLAGSLAVAGLGVFYWSNQPEVTKLAIQQNVKGATTPDYTTKAYSNDYFNAQIAARFSSRTSTIGSGKPLLLQQLMAAPTGSSLYTDQFASAVGVTPPGGLSEVSDVQLRTRTTGYKAISFSWLDPTINLAFEKNDQAYELDVFLLHGPYYVTLALSGLNENKQQLTHEMQLFVSSIVWK